MVNLTKNSKNIGMSELIKIKSLMENKKDKPVFISDPDNDYIQTRNLSHHGNSHMLNRENFSYHNEWWEI